MQLQPSNSSDSNCTSSSNNNINHSTNNSMAPQGQAMQPISALQQHQPQPLAQLNPLQQWSDSQHQQQQQAQAQLQLQAQQHQLRIATPTASSAISVAPTMVSASSKPSSSKTNPQVSSHHHLVSPRVKRVGGQGPTPEVAQQLRFPWKLHLLLERCEYEHEQRMTAIGDPQHQQQSSESFQDMPISWLPCGKAFKVHDKKRFVKEIMPSFFGTQSFKTFQRNLNLWGFTRVSKGPQKDVCSHPLFLKGFPAVCQSMKRIVLKGTGRGNRAPLGGVDVSSVQAVVAAAAMQQAQQQQASGVSAFTGINQIPQHIQAQQILQQQQIQAQHKKNGGSNESTSPSAGANNNNTMNHIHHQKPHQQLQMQATVAQNQQQQQFVIKDGTIHAATVPSQQKLVVLPSSSPVPCSTKSTVLWPNSNTMAQQTQPQNQIDPNIQNSLQQLGAIIQQLNGCNSMATAAMNTTNLQQLQQSAQMMQQQQQQFQQTQHQQQFQPPQQFQAQQHQLPVQAPVAVSSSSIANPNAIAAPAAMGTQDLLAMLLQGNLQQQVQQQQQQPQQQQQQQQQVLQPTQQQQVQLQLPTSLFPSGPFLQQPQHQQQQQLLVNSNNDSLNQFAVASNGTDFVQQSQQGAIFQQQGATPAPAVNPNFYNSSNSEIQQQQAQHQQNQLLQLLLMQQQNGLAAPSST